MQVVIVPIIKKEADQAGVLQAISSLHAAAQLCMSFATFGYMISLCKWDCA